MMAASSTVVTMGPGVSRVWDSGTMPSVGRRPSVVFQADDAAERSG